MHPYILEQSLLACLVLGVSLPLLASPEFIVLGEICIEDVGRIVLMYPSTSPSSIACVVCEPLTEAFFDMRLELIAGR